MQPDHKFSVTAEFLDNERLLALVIHEISSLRSSVFSVLIEFFKLPDKFLEFFELKI